MTRPLAGLTILVTRAKSQATELVHLLQASGGETMVLPTIAVEPPADLNPLQRAVDSLSCFNWLIFTSANAVEAFVACWTGSPGAIGVQGGLGSDGPGGVKVAVVGARTASALAAHGIMARVRAGGGNAASLAEGLLAVARPGERFLYPRAEQISWDLPGRLREAGYEVVDPIAYRTVAATSNAELVTQRLAEGTLQWITVTSGSAVRSLVDLVGLAAIRRARVASIGPSTSAVAQGLGLTVTAQAIDHTARGLVDAITAFEATQATASVQPPPCRPEVLPGQ